MRDDKGRYGCQSKVSKTSTTKGSWVCGHGLGCGMNDIGVSEVSEKSVINFLNGVDEGRSPSVGDKGVGHGWG